MECRLSLTLLYGYCRGTAVYIVDIEGGGVLTGAVGGFQWSVSSSLCINNQHQHSRQPPQPLPHSAYKPVSVTHPVLLLQLPPGSSSSLLVQLSGGSVSQLSVREAHAMPIALMSGFAQCWRQIAPTCRDWWPQFGVCSTEHPVLLCCVDDILPAHWWMTGQRLEMELALPLVYSWL